MMYPLRFDPIFRRYIWGGRKLADVLRKPIGNESCAESWEIVDHDDDQSVVQFGPLGGTTLGSLTRQCGPELLGASVHEQIGSPDLPPQLQHRFPLLLKFLDAAKPLSVQVHPDDASARNQSPPDLGKTEAWYVLHAEPGARIFAGLKKGVTRDQFEQAVKDKTTESLLHSFEPSAGDCVFIQAGTLHAIGSGLLIAEIQQSSDTTFRIFDWNRVDDQGNSRPLHIEQGLAAVDFQRGPVDPVQASRIDERTSLLIRCEKFEMRRWQTDEPVTVGDGNCFRILAVVHGSLMVPGSHCDLPLSLGQTMLIPAECGATELLPTEATEFLEIRIPDRA